MKTEDIKELLDKLLDADNREPVEIVNSKGETARFGPIALLPITVDSEEDECESVNHYFAFLQPFDESDEAVGSEIIFDIAEKSGSYTIDVVTDQYLITGLYDEYRKLRRSGSENDELTNGEEADDDNSSDADEISDEQETDDNISDDIAEIESEIVEEIKENEAESKSEKKKGFFKKLFGK